VKRYHLWVLLFISTLLGLGLFFYTKINAAPKPDIVVIMVDDMGEIDSRIYDRLPNIKSLFRDNGLRFDKAYSETPLCCPGRASFLTGQHTKKHTVTYNDARRLNPNNTIAVALHGSGYWTVMTGKYMNGAASLTDKTPVGWDRVAFLGANDATSSTFYVQGTPVSKGYKDRFTANKALEWLKASPKDKPIFMWVNPTAPHKGADGAYKAWEPYVEPKYASDARCNGIAPYKPPDYAWSTQPNGFPLVQVCRSLLTVDDTVKMLREEMQRQGRNPIWVFTSDNGMSWGSDGYPMKNVPQSTKIPLYFSGPGIPKGFTNILVSSIDIGPTLADLGGTRMPWADGISFAPFLRGEQFFGRKWMLEDHPLGGNDRAGGTTGKWWAIRTPEWRYLEWPKRGGYFLFDLVNDPWEEKNLYATRPDKVAELKALLSTYPLITPTPTPSPTASPSATLSPTPDASPSPSLSPTPFPTDPPPPPDPEVVWDDE
jgi:N-acetylglucosamine-6-sulfatase